MLRCFLMLGLALVAASSALAQDCAQLAGRVPWGPATAVGLSNTHVLFSSGSILQVADVSDPQAPVVVGAVELAEPPRDIRVRGTLALVAVGGQGLASVDVSDPALPLQVGSLAGPGWVGGVAALGHYAYLAAGDAGLRVVDVTDPSAPVEVGSLATPGSARNLAAHPSWHVMIVDQQHGLLVVDVSNPEAPVQVGSWTGWTGTALDVDVSLTHAVVSDASLAGTLWVVDITDPTQPQQVGEMIFGAEEVPESVTLEGGLAYVTSRRYDVWAGLRIVDVSSPTNPIQAGMATTPGTPVRVVIAEGRAYVAAGSAGVRILDVSIPSIPLEVGSLSAVGSLDGVAAAPGLAVVADSDLGVRVIDVSTPATPTEVGFAPTAAGAHRVAVAGDLAYVANRQTGLDIVDLSVASAPTVVGSYEMATGHGLSVLGHHVFLAANVGDLLVVDVSQPTIPLVAGNLSLAGLAVDTAVAGNLLAVASSDLANAVLTIVDVTVPPYPVELGALVRPGWPKRVAFDGHRAYLAIGGYGLTLVDVSDPAAPHETATFDAGPWTGALDVAIAHNHAFVADSAGGLRVVNVANPLWPREVGWYEASGAAGVDVRGGEAYLSTVDGGLLLLDVSGCVGELLVDGFESGDVAGWSAGGSGFPFAHSSVARG